MAEVRLQATKRAETGKGPARRARRAGRLPATVYGHGMDPVSIELDRREFVTALHTDAGMNVLLDLELDGDTFLTLTKELQRDPVRGSVLHADFVRIDRTQEVEVEVPVHIVGEAPGVDEGGVLEQPLFQIHVRCRAVDVPESIDADVSALTIGDSLRVSDLSEGRSFTILNDPESVVASVVPPISEADLEPDLGIEPTEVTEEEAAEAAAEGEVPAEGAAPAEAAGDEGGSEG
ncbi:MAG: 50S ribosomal protein L25 [Actinomycetota bacterium]